MRVPDIYLRHFSSFALSYVGHIERYGENRIDPLARITTGRLDIQIAVLEGRVGESITEREQRLCPVMLIPAVTHKHAFLINDAVRTCFWIVTVVCRIVFPAA